MKIKLFRTSQGFLEARCEAPSWSDGIELIHFLKKQFGGRIIAKAEGPDARTWKVLIDGQIIAMDQYDTGDLSISAKEITGEPVFTHIAESLRVAASWEELRVTV